MAEHAAPKRVLYIQKPEVLPGQRDEVLRWFGEHMPASRVSFAAFGDVPQGEFDCVIAPAAPPTFAALASVTGVRWVHFMGAGVDAVADEIAARPDVRFTTSSGVNADAIAEYVIGGLLYFVKRFADFDAYRRERRWQRHWLRELTGQRLLCLGVGAVGQAVAVRAKAFGMQVTGVARNADRNVAGFDALVASGSLATALPEADAVVCALPYTPETHHLIGSAALAAMKPTALLVNVARGGVVDTTALVDALRSKRIGGAVLDVFEEEPLAADSPLWGLDNVLMTPHVSGTTDLYLERMLAAFSLHSEHVWRDLDQ